jgi:hypothetical protein
MMPKRFGFVDSSNGDGEISLGLAVLCCQEAQVHSTDLISI